MRSEVIAFYMAIEVIRHNDSKTLTRTKVSEILKSCLDTAYVINLLSEIDPVQNILDLGKE